MPHRDHNDLYDMVQMLEYLEAAHSGHISAIHAVVATHYDRAFQCQECEGTGKTGTIRGKRVTWENSSPDEDIPCLVCDESGYNLPMLQKPTFFDVYRRVQ